MCRPYYPPAERTALLSNDSAKERWDILKSAKARKGLATPGVDKRKIFVKTKEKSK